MSAFTSRLVATPTGNGRTWFLVEPLSYAVGDEHSTDVITVPGGFETDFASIPRVLWWLLPPYGKYGNAAVIHDYLYRTKTRSRLRSDQIFREAMGVLGVPAWQRTLIYLGVRAGGAGAWDSIAGA